MSSLVQSIPIFILVLGSMIFIHELGHFLVAKWLGIRVEVFSLGFGKRIWGFTWGDTEYRLAILPLGGYVKMAGENIAEDRVGAPDEFLSHSKWHRFLVAIAGPAANILTALAIPFLASMVHYEVDRYKLEPPVVANTKVESPAANALHQGDLITAFNGEPVPTWRDLEDKVMMNPSQTVTLGIDRGGQPMEIPVKLDEFNVGGEKIGDLGAQPSLPGAKVVVSQVLKGKPAEAAGMMAGDEIVSVNGTEIGPYPSTLIRIINENAGKPVTLTVKRQSGEVVQLNATPDLEDGVGRLGFAPRIANVPKIDTPLGPVAAFNHAVETNMRFLRLTGAAFGQIFKGDRSVRDSLAGPIGIASIVDQASQQGAMSVLELMGLLSLNLGIFNLLPIPVLDGGLIFMLGLEALLGLFGLRLSMVVKERMINVGLVLIVLLMGFVIFNDIQRYIIGSSTSEETPAQVEPAPPPTETPPETPVVPIK